MNLVVSDASPIRYLVAIGAIHILPELFSKVIIPEFVITTELQGRKTPSKVKEWASNPPSWVDVRKPAKLEILNLHTGQEEAIALALELRTPIQLDEKEARGVAKRKGLLVIGTIGLLELAASKHLVDLTHALAALQKTNMRVHPSLLQAALKRQIGVPTKPPQEGSIE